MDLLCLMWDANPRGVVSHNYQAYSRLFGCDESTAKASIEELVTAKICDCQDINNTIVTLSCRRMLKDEKLRNDGAERQRRLREKGGGDPEKWASIRIKILERDEYSCAYCGRRANTVDHVIPKSRGGDEHDFNLVACCKRCNMEKTNKTPEEAGLQFWKSFQYIKEVSHHCNIKVTPYIPDTIFQIPEEKKNNKRKKSFESAGVTIEGELMDYAKTQGYTEDKAKSLFDAFKDHHIAKHSCFMDWTAAWRTWLRNDIKFNGPPTKPAFKGGW